MRREVAFREDCERRGGDSVRLEDWHLREEVLKVKKNHFDESGARER